MAPTVDVAQEEDLVTRIALGIMVEMPRRLWISVKRAQSMGSRREKR